MLIKWGFGGMVLVIALLMYQLGIGYFFSDLGGHLLMSVVIGFPLGIVVRKWILRTFWM